MEEPVCLSLDGLADDQRRFAHQLTRDGHGVAHRVQVESVAVPVAGRVVAAVLVPQLAELGQPAPPDGEGRVLGVIDELVLVVGHPIGDAWVGRVGHRLGVVEGDASVGHGLVDLVEVPSQLGGHSHPAAGHTTGEVGAAGQPGGGAQTELAVAHLADLELGQHVELGGLEGGQAGFELDRGVAQLGIGGERQVVSGCFATPFRQFHRLEHMIESSGTYRLLQDVSPCSPVFHPVDVLVTMPSRTASPIGGHTGAATFNR